MPRILRGSVLIVALALAGCPKNDGHDPQNGTAEPAASSASSASSSAKSGEPAGIAFDKGDFELAAAEYAKQIESGPAEGQPRARVRLAQCFDRLGLPRVAFSMLEETVAANPSQEGFRALAAVAVKLPGVESGRGFMGFSAEQRKAELGSLGKDTAARVHYLVGRELTGKGELEAAIGEYDLVEGDLAIKANIQAGLVWVQLHKAVPAVERFDKAISLAEGKKDAEAQRLSDLAKLQKARVYYTASFTTSKDDPKKITHDEVKLSTAVKYFRDIQPTSESFRDAAGGLAWALYAAGDYKGALDAIAAATQDKNAYEPEVELLASTVLWSMKDDKKATAAVDAFLAEYEPLAAALSARAAELDKAAESPSGIAWPLDKPGSSDLARALGDALGGRDLKALLDDLALLDGENAAAGKLSAALRTSPAGGMLTEALDALRADEKKRLSALVVARVHRAEEELAGFVEQAKVAKDAAKKPAGKSTPAKTPPKKSK
ncbi:MAG: hypothetical protein U0271_11245 [Polyangiaceae bacterium]